MEVGDEWTEGEMEPKIKVEIHVYEFIRFVREAMLFVWSPESGSELLNDYTFPLSWLDIFLTATILVIIIIIKYETVLKRKKKNNTNNIHDDNHQLWH